MKVFLLYILIKTLICNSDLIQLENNIKYNEEKSLNDKEQTITMQNDTQDVLRKSPLNTEFDIKNSNEDHFIILQKDSIYTFQLKKKSEENTYYMLEFAHQLCMNGNKFTFSYEEYTDTPTYKNSSSIIVTESTYSTGKYILMLQTDKTIIFTLNNTGVLDDNNEQDKYFFHFYTSNEQFYYLNYTMDSFTIKRNQTNLSFSMKKPECLTCKFTINLYYFYEYKVLGFPNLDNIYITTHFQMMHSNFQYTETDYSLIVKDQLPSDFGRIYVGIVFNVTYELSDNKINAYYGINDHGNNHGN